MNGEGALAGAPDDLNRSVVSASEAPHLTAEYRGGPIATARLIIDCYVRPDPAWESIQPSRPDDEVRPSQNVATLDTSTGELEA